MNIWPRNGIDTLRPLLLNCMLYTKLSVNIKQSKVVSSTNLNVIYFSQHEPRVTLTEKRKKKESSQERSFTGQAHRTDNPWVDVELWKYSLNNTLDHTPGALLLVFERPFLFKIYLQGFHWAFFLPIRTSVSRSDQWCSLSDMQVYAVFPLGKVKDFRIPT